MIGIIFSYLGETIEVRVEGEIVLFRTSTFGSRFTDISGLKLNKSGCIKEFPELVTRTDWKEESIKRFKEKIIKMNNEQERAKYVISDLIKHGYKPMYLQRQGFRPIKL